MSTILPVSCSSELPALVATFDPFVISLHKGVPVPHPGTPFRLGAVLTNTGEVLLMTEPTSSYSATYIYQEEAHAQQTYQQVSALIEYAPRRLSAYRFCLQTRWHVMVVGHPPDPALQRHLEAVLHARGVETTLPPELHARLVVRHQTYTSQGIAWQQYHYPRGSEPRLRPANTPPMRRGGTRQPKRWRGRKSSC